MQLTGNTILIPDAGSFVMMELIERLYALGNTLIIGNGYTKKLAELKKTKVRGSRIFAKNVDVLKAGQRERFVQRALKSHPEINAVILYSYGFKADADFKNGVSPWAVEMQLQYDIVAPIHFTALLSEHLLLKPNACIIFLSPVPACVPLWASPMVSTAHAALHAFADSLRIQLENSGVKVFELTQPFLEYWEATNGIELYEGIEIGEYCNRILTTIEQDAFEERITAKNATDAIYGAYRK